MNLREKFNNIVMSLSTTEVANAASMVKSPIDAAASDLSTNPKQGKIGSYPYIKFGTSDDIPEVLSNLIGKSATHAGIIGKKGKMIAGKHLEYGGSGSKGNGSKAIEWKVFQQNAGGVNKSLDSQFKIASYNYVAYGAAAFLVTQKGKGNIVGFKSIPPKNLRLGIPDNNGVIKGMVWREVFKNVSGSIFKGRELFYNFYDKDSSDKESIIYIANPESDNPFYGVPNYIGAYNFIEADFEFGVTIKNAATNGFNPKVLTTFMGRSMTDEQKREQSRKLKNNFQGSDSEQMIVSFVRKKEDAPIFTPLDVTNLDKQMDIMSQLNDAKILTAHSVTAPALFGVVTASKLGVSGSELQDAYGILMSTEIMPSRELLLSNLTYVFANTQFEKIEITVSDEPLISFEKRGGDEDANGNNITEKTTEKNV